MLLGPKAHSTFEVGEPSNIAMEEARFNAKPIESESGCGLDPVSLSDLSFITQLNKAEISVLEECSKGEVLERTEMVRKAYMAATSTWVDCSLIFKDRR